MNFTASTLHDSVLNLLNHPIFITVSTISTLWFIIPPVRVVITTLKGISKVLYRFGYGIMKREIAVFGSIDAYLNIQTTLIDSKIFRKKNIIHIAKNNIDKAKQTHIFIIDWDTCHSYFNEILNVRQDNQCPIIVYARPGSIPPDKLDAIGNRSNTIIANLRGRLINDTLTCLITTCYE